MTYWDFDIFIFGVCMHCQVVGKRKDSCRTCQHTTDENGGNSDMSKWAESGSEQLLVLRGFDILLEYMHASQVQLMSRYIQYPCSCTSCLSLLCNPYHPTSPFSGGFVSSFFWWNPRKSTHPNTCHTCHTSNESVFLALASVSPSPNPPKKQDDDLELPEYMAPELGWLGVELAEALPEEFVLVRGVGTGQLVAVWSQRQKWRNESWKLGELRGGSVGVGELRVEVVLVANFWNSNCANELESRSEMVPDSRRSCLVWDSVLWVSHWLSGWLEREEERLGLEIP